MKTINPLLMRACAFVLFLGLVGAGYLAAGAAPAPEKKDPPKVRKVKVGDNVTLEVQGDKRRVLINAQVVLRKGPLELFLCRKESKEHESILNADIDARDLHKALLITGAKPGTTCEYTEKKIKPATGTAVKISVQYEEKGKTVTVPAGTWVRNMKTRKELKENWVFAGSKFVKNVLDPKKPDIYLANYGDVITISNFEDSLLDLPIASSKDDADRSFEANTDKIPKLETKVIVILEPILDKKNKK
jgi:hypothetical protein